MHPTVVAITGSYGKTSTKGHIAHLVRPDRTVVATPASFNNRAGLARAINEHLAEGTEVFVAEMGTYGPGEIADLCRWCPPDVAVITAIGPVHLERFGTEDRIVEAKSEILGPAADVVLPVDDPRLAAVADRGRGGGEAGRSAARPPTGRPTSAVVRTAEGGRRCRCSPGGPPWPRRWPCRPASSRPTWPAPWRWPWLLGVDPAAVGAAGWRDLPAVDHRLQAMRSPSGVAILDDTYNANPAGAAAALRPGPSGAPSTGDRDAGRRVVVTPGMVELGTRQAEENRRFGAAVGRGGRPTW